MVGAVVVVVGFEGLTGGTGLAAGFEVGLAVVVGMGAPSEGLA